MANPITIPYNFEPRPYQAALMAAIDAGYKRAIARYHRRAGKDKSLFNLTIKKAFERRGAYYYLFPELTQARRVIWDGQDGSGMPFMDHIPKELIASKNSTDMKIGLANGSFIQLVGTDRFDKVRGSNPVGCVFSEYAFQDPMAWEVIRPIMAENGGWAVFNSSTNGKNHFHDLVEMAEKNDKWFVQNITVEDSLDYLGNRYISEEDIQDERDAGMSDDMIQQEFFNSWTANAQGFYYLKDMKKSREESRIGLVAHDPVLPVETYWDIGVGDSTAIWFLQKEGNQFNFIDFYQNNGQGLDHYAHKLMSLPYQYSTHNFPHDMIQTEFGTGRSRFEVAQSLLSGGNVILNILPKLSVEDGINAARMIFPRCSFDKERCAIGIKALENYRKEWDSKYQEFKQRPVRDWTTHAADAFRYAAVGVTYNKKKNPEDRFKRYKRRTSTNNWMTT